MPTPIRPIDALTAPDENDENYKQAIAQIDDILEKSWATGRLMVTANNGAGKTFVLMWLWRRVLAHPKHAENYFKTIAFDVALNLRYKFDAVPYVNYREVKVLPRNLDLIVDVLDTDPYQRRLQIMDVMVMDYNQKRKMKAELNGKVSFINNYFIDEMSTVYDTYSLNTTGGRVLFDLFAQGRNFGICVFGFTQRLGEVSTKIVERTNYFLLGRTSGDNDLHKIKNMFGSQIATDVKSLGERDFIFHNVQEQITKVIHFPTWFQRGTPFKGDSLNLANGYVKILHDDLR
jgi:hypothetical protein